MAGGLVDLYGGKGKSSSSSSGGVVDLYGGGKKTKSGGGGGGILGALGSAAHWLGSKASLAGHDIAAMPVETAQLANIGVVQPWKNLFTTGHPYAHGAGKNIDKATNQVFASTAETLAHPLRDPFATALTVAPVGHVPFRAAELARGVDVAAPRTLKVGEAEVPLPPVSGNAAVRAGQRLYAGGLQRALEQNPEGRLAAHAMKRVGGSLAETSRYQARLREVPAVVLEHAGRELKGKLGKHLPFGGARAAQAALRLTSENVTPEEAAAFHRARAAAGVNPAANLRLTRMYDAIASSRMLTRDGHGNVIVDAKVAPRLAEADAALARAQTAAEQIVHEHGLMTPEGQQARVNLPGMIRRVGISETERAGPVYGHQGRGYVPYKVAEPKPTSSPIARAGSQVVGKARSPIGAQEFTGAGLEQGLVPDNTTGLVARHLRQLYRYVNTDQFRRKVLSTGSETKQSSRDILVRIPDQPASRIGLNVERDLGRKNITLDELAGHRQRLTDYIRHVIPGYEPDAVRPRDQFKAAASEAARYGIGEKAPAGFKWVDRNALGDLGNAFAFSRGSAGRFADNVNSAVTLATVYLKPGHLPQRSLTNATTVLFQTSLNPFALKDAVTLWRQLNHEDRLRALAAGGQSGYEAMPHEGTGFVGRQATKGANWWARHVDAPFRFANVAYEARKAGYKTPAAFRRFLHVLEQPDRFPKAEALRADAAAKEANRAGIAYDRMSDVERRTVGRLVWFYPWLRNSTLYTGRILTTHPFKASIMAQLGVTGRNRQESILGALPSYEYGLTPVGAGKVSDLGRLFPFSTAADVLQLPQHTGGARGNLNPAYSALMDVVTGTNSFGGPTKTPVTTALQDLLAPAPEAQILTGYLHRNQDQSKRMFPNSGRLAGTEDPLLRALLGSWYPRRINTAAANKAAARESGKSSSGKSSSLIDLYSH